MDEKALNKAFVEEAQRSSQFVVWLLSRTKFRNTPSRLVLARGDNPWYRSKKTGKDSETDILLVFETPDTRFALHLENKTPAMRGFRPNQPQDYQERATDWLNTPKWGSYRDFEIGIIAPLVFRAANKAECDVFHRFLSYEEIAAWIPEFAASGI